jgi:type IV fimbrial biogenesis protein FimT
MNKRSRGFTLPELMVVLALAAMILAIGVPNFRDFQRNNRLTVAANDTLGMMLTSRSEALRRQTIVSMCPSATPDADDATCGAGAGWIVFEDPDGDCQRGGAEEKITDVRIDNDVEGFANSNCISFATNGFKRVIAGEPTTAHFLYCDERGNVARNSGGTDSTARGIEVLPTGRAAVVKSVDEIDSWGGGGGVSCE